MKKYNKRNDVGNSEKSHVPKITELDVAETVESPAKKFNVKTWFKSHLKKLSSKEEIKNEDGRVEQHGSAVSHGRNPKSIYNSIEAERQSHRLSQAVGDFVKKTPLCITILGPAGVGKAVLLNTLLQATLKKSSRSTTASAPALLESSQKDIHNDKRGEYVIQPDTQFFRSINHVAENQAGDKIKAYGMTLHPPELDDRHVFIIPQGNIGGPAITFQYGDIPELIVKYPPEEKLRRTLFALHEVETGRRNCTYWEFRALRMWYERVLGVKRESVPAAYTRSANLLPIPDTLRRKLGRTFRYVGSGLDFDADRIFVREKLNSVCQSIGFFAEEVIIKMPCEIIDGSVRIVASNSDICYGPTLHQMIKALKESNLLCLTVDHRGITSDIKQLLVNSQFINELCRANSDRRVLLLYMSSERAREGRSNIAPLDNETQTEIANQFLQGFRQILAEHCSIPEIIEDILQNTRFLPLKPILYQSVVANGPTFMPEKFGMDSAAKVKSSTNIPALVGYIRNILVSRCAATIKHLSISLQRTPIVIKQSRNSQNEATTRNEIIKETPRSFLKTVEILINKFIRELTQWSSELKQTEQLLNSKIQNLSSDDRARNHLTQHADQTVPFYNRLLKETSTYWQELVREQSERFLEDVNEASADLMSECIRMSEKAGNLSIKDKLYLEKLLWFFQDDSIQEKFQRLEDVISKDPSVIIKEASSEFLTANDMTQPGVTPFGVLHYISTKFSTILGNLLALLSSIEKELSSILENPSAPSHQNYASSITARSFSPPLRLGSIVGQSPEDSSPESQYQICRRSPLREPRSNFIVYSERSNPRVFSPSSWQSPSMFGSQGQTNYMRYQKQLQAAGLKSVNIVHDGNAQFRAFGHQAYGTETSFPVVRLLVMNEILKHDAHYSKFLEPRGVDLQEYVCEMSKDGAWGDSLTLCALSHAYSCDIVIYSPMFSTPLIVHPRSNPHNTMYALGYVNGNHFLSLVDQYDETSAVSEFSSSSSSSSVPIPLSLKSNSNEDVIMRESTSIDSTMAGSNDIVETPLSRIISDQNRNHNNTETRLFGGISFNAEGDGMNVDSGASGSLSIASSTSMQLTRNMGANSPSEFSFSGTGNLRLSQDDLFTKQKSLFNTQTSPKKTSSRTGLNHQACFDYNSQKVGHTLSFFPAPTTTPGFSVGPAPKVDEPFPSYMDSSETKGESWLQAGGKHNRDEWDVRPAKKSREKKMKMTVALANRAKVMSVRPLKEMCVSLVVSHIDMMPCLDGAIPQELVQSLITAIISEVKMTNDILERLIDNSISRLDLSHSKQITDESAAVIASKCKNLANLILSKCNSITSQGIQIISKNCSLLETVDLSGCQQIDDDAIFALAHYCKALQSINLEGCNITDKALEEISSFCPHVSVLCLKKCTKITDTGFEQLSKSLMKLDLSECNQLTDSAVVNIANQSDRLMTLKLCGQRITDKSLRHMAAQMSQLRELELDGCENVSDATVCRIAESCHGLEVLKLSSCPNISLHTSITSRSLCNLHTLDLTSCLNISSDALGRFCSHTPHMQHLNLQGCINISDAGLLEVIDRCRLIKSLNIKGCKKISSHAVKHMCMQLNELISLNLAGLAIDDDTIATLTRVCTKIKNLDLSTCERITDSSVKMFSQGFQCLETLSLEEIPDLTDASLSTLGACSCLKVLKLGYCPKVTDASLKRIAHGCPDIEIIDLSYCNSLSFECIRDALQLWPNLVELVLKGYTLLTNGKIEHKRLERLNLSWNRNLEDEAVISIAAGCPRLEALNIAWCTQITGPAVSAVVKNCHQLHTLNLKSCTKISPLMAKVLKSQGKIAVFR